MYLIYLYVILLSAGDVLGCAGTTSGTVNRNWHHAVYNGRLARREHKNKRWLYLWRFFDDSGDDDNDARGYADVQC